MCSAQIEVKADNPRCVIFSTVASVSNCSIRAAIFTVFRLLKQSNGSITLNACKPTGQSCRFFHCGHCLEDEHKGAVCSSYIMCPLKIIPLCQARWQSQLFYLFACSAVATKNKLMMVIG